MAIDTVVAKIGFTANIPFGKWQIAVIKDLLRLFIPINPLGLLRPKLLAIINRGLINVGKALRAIK